MGLSNRMFTGRLLNIHGESLAMCILAEGIDNLFDYLGGYCIMR